jgi:hypothetical protein
MEASSRQLIPASLWLDVVFAVEVKAFQLSPAQAGPIIGSIRKHLRNQRKEHQNVFGNLENYLEYILTFVDTVLSTHFDDNRVSSSSHQEAIQELAKVRNKKKNNVVTDLTAFFFVGFIVLSSLLFPL